MSPERIADALARLTKDGDCSVCENSEDDCNRYHEWCFGRTARATASNPGWRVDFVSQIHYVLDLEFMP